MINNFINSTIRLIPFLILIVHVFVLAGCETGSPDSAGPSVIELTDFETFVAFEDNLLATPVYIRLDNDANLFVNDAGNGTIIKLSEDGEIINSYGRQGNGPGEFQWANHISLTADDLYIVDTGRFMVHKYKIKDGFDSSLDYGEMGYLPSTPQPPVSTSAIIPANLANQPHITADGHIMLSRVGTGETAQSLYKKFDWQKNQLSNIGTVPEGSTFILDNQEIRNHILNRDIPSYYKPRAFPVNDGANPDEIFMIYNALPVLAKYSVAGGQLWTTEISGNPEIDSIENHFFETMEQMQRNDIRNRIDLSYYHAGVSSPDGELYLVTNPDSIWIHRFNPRGELTHRYHLFSEDVNLMPVFDINFTSNTIFIVTEEGGIRIYPFG